MYIFLNYLEDVLLGQLQDLVYKQGQADLIKVTVSITFDNRDKKNGPVGYHHCDEIVIRRQIIVNGRNPYTINGSTAANAKLWLWFGCNHSLISQRVSDFFGSVGLNPNPHFLIMQGRITKILNVKSHEILGMIEVAAGTKLYEAKRALAPNTTHKMNSEQCEQLALNKGEEIKSLGSELEEIEALLEVQQTDFTRVEEAKKRGHAEAFAEQEGNVAEELAKIDEEKRECKESFGEVFTGYEEKSKSLNVVGLSYVYLESNSVDPFVRRVHS
uniref:SMC hinge domain-containing protein n=1 Tax=Heligmosomoides polygyrus TaxID=6339 RepID=A0A183FBD6_HELPZ